MQVFTADEPPTTRPRGNGNGDRADRRRVAIAPVVRDHRVAATVGEISRQSCRVGVVAPGFEQQHRAARVLAHARGHDTSRSCPRRSPRFRRCLRWPCLRREVVPDGRAPRHTHALIAERGADADSRKSRATELPVGSGGAYVTERHRRRLRGRGRRRRGHRVLRLRTAGSRSGASRGSAAGCPVGDLRVVAFGLRRRARFVR